MASKPLAHNAQVHRQNKIRQLITRKPNITPKHIINALNEIGISVSRRTIQRDLDAIKAAGIELVHETTAKEHAADGMALYAELLSEAWQQYHRAQKEPDTRKRNVGMGIWFDKICKAREGIDKLLERIGVYQSGQQINITVATQMINELSIEDKKKLFADELQYLFDRKIITWHPEYDGE